MLRKLEHRDAPFMLEWMHDEAVNCFFRFDFNSMTEKDAIRFIDESFTDVNQHFAFTDEYDEYVGTISLKNICYEDKSAEYAIVTRKKAQGTGLAYRATQDIIVYAIQGLGLEKIYLNVFDYNERAIRFYKKCGFKYTGKDITPIFNNGRKYELDLYELKLVDFELSNYLIEGKLINLRPINKNDTDYIIKWRNNPYVRKNFIFREQFTSEMHYKWLEEKVKTGKTIQYIIETKMGDPVGSVYFRDIDRENGIAEYGMFIGEDSARGKGYGTEAVSLFTDFGNSIGLKNILIRVLDSNEISAKSCQKAGFAPIDCIETTASDGELLKVIIMEKKYD